jgi:hypothetical protein
MVYIMTILLLIEKIHGIYYDYTVTDLFFPDRGGISSPAFVHTTKKGRNYQDLTDNESKSRYTGSSGQVSEIYMYRQVSEIYMYRQVSEIYMYRQVSEIYMYRQVSEIYMSRYTDTKAVQTDLCYNEYMTFVGLPEPL